MKNKLVKSADTDVNEKIGNELISDVIGSSEETNKYFGNVSFIYRVFEFAFLAVFLLFLLFSAIGNAGEVTYSKLEYIFRNFAMKLDENSEIASEIVYNPDTSVNYALYGNGIAVCGNSGITVFSATGRKTCNISFELEDPIMRSSSKYILVFDNGKKYYCLFNMFSRVFEKETDYPVRGAAVADNGSYAIITGSDMYTSCVEVYDSNCQLRARYSKNGYIICAAFSPDGKRLVYATLNMNSDGKYITEISLNTLGEDYADAVYTLEEEVPLGVNFTDDYICFVCKNNFYVFNGELTLLTKRGYAGRSLTDFAMSKSALCLVLENNKSTLNRTRSAEIYSYSGTPGGSFETSDTIDSVCMSGSYAYLLTGGEPVLVTDKGNTYKELSGKITPKKILAYAEGRIYICCASAAYVTEFAQN